MVVAIFGCGGPRPNTADGKINLHTAEFIRFPIPEKYVTKYHKIMVQSNKYCIDLIERGKS